MMEISNAYSKALELEGLLLLLKSENTDNFKIDLIFTRLFEKMDEINADLMQLRRQYRLELYHAAEQHVKENSQIVSVSESVAPETVIEDKESADVVSSDCPVDNSEKEEIIHSPVETVDTDSERIDDEAVAENALFEEEEDADMTLPETESSPIEDAPQPECSCSEKGTPDIAANTPTEMPVNIVIEDAGVDVNRSAFALRARGDIRKIFTLNDNYKFRRQLFSNSQELFADALLKIENMKSTYEAEDYFYNTLKWDKDNPDVKDFMTIISAYFLGK